MQAFLLFHPFLEKRAFFSHPFVFGGLFCTYDVRACFRRAFAIHCNASTEQRSSTESAQHKAAKQVRANQSATVQARGQTWLSQHVVEHSHSSLRSKNERRNQNLPHQKKYAWYIHNHSQSSLAGVIREDTALLEDLSPRPYGAFRECIPCSGCFSSTWSSWHLQVVSLHLKSWTSLSASFGFCCMFFLVSERSGRRKPRAERSALYHRAYMSCL